MDLVNGHEVIWVQEAGIADSKWLSKACVQVQEPCVSLEVLPFSFDPMARGILAVGSEVAPF